MVKKVIFGAIAASAIAFTAHAAPSTPSLWEHNGSTVYLLADGANREFHYDQPRPGMLEAGAQSGSLLFTGRSVGGRYVGTGPDIRDSYAYAPPPSWNPGQLLSGTELVVVNIGPNDVLHIREYATDNSSIVGFIPPDARGITYLGESQGQWIFVRYEDQAEGWVSRRFVQPIPTRGRRL
jgi:hypothetical protein